MQEDEEIEVFDNQFSNLPNLQPTNATQPNPEPHSPVHLLYNVPSPTFYHPSQITHLTLRNFHCLNPILLVSVCRILDNLLVHTPVLLFNFLHEVFSMTESSLIHGDRILDEVMMFYQF